MLAQLWAESIVKAEKRARQVDLPSSMRIPKKNVWFYFDVDYNKLLFLNGLPKYRDTQRIVSANYLFGRPLIPSDFLNRIITSNFREMRNLMPAVFGLIKISFWVPKKGQLRFSEKQQDLRFSGNEHKSPNKFEKTHFPLEYPNR